MLSARLLHIALLEECTVTTGVDEHLLFNSTGELHRCRSELHTLQLPFCSYFAINCTSNSQLSVK